MELDYGNFLEHSSRTKIWSEFQLVTLMPESVCLQREQQICIRVEDFK